MYMYMYMRAFISTLANRSVILTGTLSRCTRFVHTWTMHSTTATPTHNIIHIACTVIMRSYCIDKEITDADAEKKRLADVLVSEVFLLPLVFTYEEWDKN